jgi:hypothetical protein
MGTLYEIEKLPTTSQDAIREFSDRYLAAQGAAPDPTWCDNYGEFTPVTSPQTSYVVSQLVSRYEQTKGEGRTKKALEGSFDVKVVEYDEGEEADLIQLFSNAFSVRRWNSAPSRFVKAEAFLRARSVRTLLEAGTSTACYDSKNFFATDHPCNISMPGLGSFSNYQGTPASCLSIDSIQAEMTSMMAVKDENGEKLGVVPDTILLPTEKFIYCAHMLEQDMVSDGTTTVSNTLKGKLKPVHCPEFTDANDWYLVDSRLVSMVPPWIAGRYTVPQALGLRIFDESSDHFKNTGRIKIASHVWYGFALGFPHAIRLVRGS